MGLLVLFGFACLQSLQHNFGGYVAFKPKTKLIPMYISKLGAKPAGISGYHLDPIDAHRLIRLIYE